MDIEADVVKRFLDGQSLERIKKSLHIDTQEVLGILIHNPATSKEIRKQSEIFLDRGYTPFFHKSSYGRPKLPETKKRKLRQIRISDEELEELGNPSSTSMRENLLYLKKLAAFLQHLDDNGIQLLPESVLHDEFDPNDPFWGPLIYGKNYSVMKWIVTTPKLWNKVVEEMKKNKPSF